MMENLPDIDRLLASPNASDEEVLAAIVACHRTSLTRLACSILRDHAEADDAVQQALLSAALHLHRYRPGTNFRAWLYTILVNTCRGMLRKQKSRQFLAALLGRSLEDRSSTEPEAAYLKAESTRRLWQAVKQLDDKHRLVVLLRYQEELTIREIAQVLSIQEKNVYTRLYAAFRQLRPQISGRSEQGWLDDAAGKETAP
jgi:RNA polymerase sigma-70 factor, ECF subfamily